MVQLAEDAQIPPGQIHRVVSGAGAVEQYHAGHEDGHGDEMLPSWGHARLDQQRHRGEYRQHHADEMGDRASGFSDCDLHMDTSWLRFYGYKYYLP